MTTRCAAWFCLTVAALTGCAQSTLDPPPPELAGIYTLRTLDGAPLPVTVTDGSVVSPFTVTADTLVITTSGAFGQWSVEDSTIPHLGVNGSALVRADSVFLLERVLGSVAARGRVAHDTLILRSLASHQFPGHNWVYVK